MELSSFTVIMFDGNKSGWLIKLIEAVEEDAIVEVEDGIAVEAICSVEAIDGSDTMKKQVKLVTDLCI